jgi:hypothetical protein
MKIAVQASWRSRESGASDSWFVGIVDTTVGDDIRRFSFGHIYVRVSPPNRGDDLEATAYQENRQVLQLVPQLCPSEAAF